MHIRIPFKNLVVLLSIKIEFKIYEYNGNERSLFECLSLNNATTFYAAYICRFFNLYLLLLHIFI